MKSFNQFVKNRSKNSAVNENDMYQPSNGNMNQPNNGVDELRQAQQEMDRLFNKLKGEKIPKILQKTMYEIGDQSRVVSNIIQKMPPAEVAAFYQQRNAQGYNRNENNMNQPSNGNYVNQLTKALKDGQVIHRELKKENDNKSGRPIDLITIHQNLVDNSKIVYDIIQKMPPAEVAAFYKDWDAQNYNQM